MNTVLTRQDLQADARDRRDQPWRRPQATPLGRPSRPLHIAPDPINRIRS